MKKIILFFCVSISTLYADEPSENVDPTETIKLTAPTEVTGISGITGHTGEPTVLLGDRTTFTVENDEKTKPFSYDTTKTYYVAQKIHACIGTLHKLLFEKPHGIATEGILSNKDDFDFYYNANYSITRHTIREFESQVNLLSMLATTCTDNNQTEVREFLGITFFTGLSIDFRSSIFVAIYDLEKSYNQLEQWFKGVEAWLHFISDADCTIKSNEALNAFMINQLTLSAHNAIAGFEKTYEKFIDAAKNSFEPKI